MKDFKVTYKMELIIEANSKMEAEKIFYSDMAGERIGRVGHSLIIKQKLRNKKKKKFCYVVGCDTDVSKFFKTINGKRYCADCYAQLSLRNKK